MIYRLKVNSDFDLKSYQSCAFGILSEFDRFAKVNNISYYIIGGTLLGAVRHKGFIPWDDDIDIGVPREDYNKLAGLRDSFQKPFVFENYEINKKYIYTFSKLYDSSTTVVEDVGFDFNRGVWIDIFPIDGAFSSNFLTRIHIKIVGFFIGLFALKSKLDNNFEVIKFNDGFFKRCLKNIIYFIPQGFNYFFVHNIASFNSIRRSGKAGNILGRYGVKEIVDKSVIFGSDNYVEFEKSFFPAPCSCHEYLESIYGDYMTMPIESERLYHPKSYFSLNESYLKTDLND